MAALEPGVPFPKLSLTDARGSSRPSAAGETLYAVFKTTCPVCEMTWPYLDRVRQAAEGGGLAVVAVSQDPPEKTAAFHTRLGVRLETAYDPEPWKTSDALGVETVPTLFRVGPTGTILETIVGWNRAGMEGLARRAAELAGRPPAPLLRPGEQMPAIKPG